MANEEEKEKVELGKLYSEVLRENLGIQRVNTDELKIQVDLSKEIGGAFRITNEQGKAILKNSRDLSKQTANILRDEEAIIKGRRSKRDIDKEITKSTLTQKTSISEIAQVTSQLASLQNRMKNDPKEVTEANMDQEKVLKNIIQGLKSNLDINRENLIALDKELEIRGRIEKKLGVLGKLVKGIGKIPIVGEFLNANKVLEEMEETAAKVGSTRFDVMTAGIMEMGAQLKENMLDPFVILTSMFAAGFTVDQSITELERSLGVSRDQATGIRKNFETLATSTKNTSINSLDIEKSFKNLQEQFGTASTILRDDIVVEMAELGKLTNMSAESQANFARFANISGKNAAVITTETRRAVVNAEQEKGLRLDINKVLDQAGKITGQIAAQLGGNVTAIASAVAVAKQFGMELEAVAASGAALLNFEQSIGNELKAELLTGKQLNLERARLAALTGDYKTLTKEINANVGDFGDFTKMNVLQQQALAESVGMTADQLSDVLLKNANIAQLAQEARLAGDEDLANQLEKRSTQEKFNDAVMKLKTIFVDIANGPVMILVEGMASILSGVGKITNALGLGKNGFGDIVVQAALLSKILFGTLNPLKGAVKLYQGIKGLVMSIRSGTLAINAAERLGLIRRGQANVLRTKEVMLQKFGNTENKIRRIYENQSLGTMIKRNAAALIGNVRKKGANALSGIGLALENAKLGSMIAQGFAVVKNIAKEGILLGIKVAQAAAALVGVSAATLGVGTIIAIAAAAAGIAYLNSISKADDMMSPPEGNSGYGSRMLLAPEGKFALNNKDTVIAGTNLFKANDIAMGNEGSINIDKLSSNNQQNDNGSMDALNSKFDALINATQTQTQTIQNKPVSQNTMIDPNSIVNPRIPFEKSSNYTAMT